MDFEEILDQAIAMLQRRGRVTYCALKRQFNLDDAFLEDLTVELIKGQRLARAGKRLGVLRPSYAVLPGHRPDQAPCPPRRSRRRAHHPRQGHWPGADSG